MSKISIIGAEIPNNQALTGEIDLGSFLFFAIELPTTWAGTTITFQSKSSRQPNPGEVEPDDQETWRNVYDDTGTEVSLTVAANRIVSASTAALKLAPLRYIRIRSGTSAAPVNQSPSKPIKLIVKE